MTSIPLTSVQKSDVVETKPSYVCAGKLDSISKNPLSVSDESKCNREATVVTDQGTINSLEGKMISSVPL